MSREEDLGDVRDAGPDTGSVPVQADEQRSEARTVVDLTAGAVGGLLDPRVQVPPEHYTRVLHDVPAAVLLVDVETGQVVHANPAARRLTGSLRLPVPSQDWRDAAALRPLEAEAYAPGASPLERAAAGQPVFGEPVSVVVDAVRRTLWVTGFPLPREAGSLALVVLFDVESTLPDDTDVRDRAVVAAGLAFTISDPRQPDGPLIYVNPAFERTTGYSADEAVGRNCRFLQGPDTDPAAVDLIRLGLAEERHTVTTLLNYRKDGTAFWNELSLSPVYDGEGELTHFVGIQADVTARVHVEQERARVLQAEQRARATAEHAQRRLALLAEATSMLASTLDVEESLVRLTELVVPFMADWCMVELVGDGGGDVRRVASSHVEPDKRELLRRAEALQPLVRNDRSPVRQVIQTGEAVLLEEVPASLPDDLDAGSELSGIYRELGLSSGIVVPLRARRQVLGALTLIRARPGRAYDEADLAMAADLARRAALTVDNARLYEREHAVAETLQRSLLPDLPDLPGMDRAARYLPGATAAQVGGDWYDLFPLRDGTIGVAVGDVMGHDMAAAAAMGQLRSVLRSYAWQDSPPSVVLQHLDELVQGLGMAQLATAIYGRLRLPSGDGPGSFCLANAGHLPPVLRTPDGRARLLDGVPGLLVGAALGSERDELTEELTAGSVLVLYTDGLVEQRGADPSESLEVLREAVERCQGATADEICNEVLAALDHVRHDDDLALLVVRVPEPA